MSGVAQQGRTILFVSHNMAAISVLCDRVLWLDQGHFRCIGSAAEIVSSYLFEKSQKLCSTWYNEDEPDPNMEASLRSVRLLTENNGPTATLDFGQPYAIEITYDVLEPVRDLSVTYHLFNSEGVLIYESMDTDMLQWRGVVREPGEYVATCRIEDSLLKPGRYYLSMVSFIERIKIIERQKEVVIFDVCEKGYFLNTGRLGVITPVYKWDVTRIDEIGNPTVIGRNSNSKAAKAGFA
jgi:lipopolysaccharide transport system ATP-binding protein